MKPFFFFFDMLIFTSDLIIKPPQNREGVIFSLQFVCVSGYSCEQSSSQTDAPI